MMKLERLKLRTIGLLLVTGVAGGTFSAGTFSAGTGATDLPDPLAAGWEGKPVCELIHEDDKLRILRCSFPPGVGHERHYHPRHVGYVLEGGTMQITDASGTRDVDVSTGGSFSSAGIPWHEALNIGDTTSSYLMIEPKQVETSR